MIIPFEDRIANITFLALVPFRFYLTGRVVVAVVVAAAAVVADGGQWCKILCIQSGIFSSALAFIGFAKLREKRKRSITLACF